MSLLVNASALEARTISFSGYQWDTKDSGAGRMGPGPNYFSENENNVWLENDDLHLRVERRSGLWYCAEVVSQSAVGYGTYRVVVEGNAEQIDPRLVFGIFTWDDGYDKLLEQANAEVDIEITRWSDSDPLAPNLYYSLQPASGDEPPYVYHERYQSSYFTTEGTHTTHLFEWHADYVEWRSYQGAVEDPAELFQSFRYERDGPEGIPRRPTLDPGQQTIIIPQPSETTKMRFNLWLNQGGSPFFPSQTENLKVVIDSFVYERRINYDDWQLDHYSLAEVANSSVASDREDHDDSDPYTNFEEFAFGGDPKQPDHSLDPSVEHLRYDDGSGEKSYLGFEYRRNPENLLTYQIQASDDLRSWSDVSLTELQVVPLGNGYETVTVRDQQAIEPGVKRFLRLKVME